MQNVTIGTPDEAGLLPVKIVFEGSYPPATVYAALLCGSEQGDSLAALIARLEQEEVSTP